MTHPQSSAVWRAYASRTGKEGREVAYDVANQTLMKLDVE